MNVISRFICLMLLGTLVTTLGSPAYAQPSGNSIQDLRNQFVAAKKKRNRLAQKVANKPDVKAVRTAIRKADNVIRSVAALKRSLQRVRRGIENRQIAAMSKEGKGLILLRSELRQKIRALKKASAASTKKTKTAKKTANNKKRKQPKAAKAKK